MNLELFVTDETGKECFMPAVEDGIEWNTKRRGTPGKLAFKVQNDGLLKISEGSRVYLRADGKGIFAGYIFSISRDKEQLLSITAYDQIRYLQNKDTFQYTATAAELVSMLAADYNLEVGELDETRYTIEDRTENNKSLLEMIENALDLTWGNTNEMFIFYDDFGKLTLKNTAGMQLPVLIDAERGENFDYSSSIDSDTYNQIKLVYENSQTGERQIFMEKDPENISKWGILQYFETLQENENGDSKKKELLEKHNQKTRKLQIKGAFGDIRVRAGSRVLVRLELGDIMLSNFMVVEEAAHNFKKDEYLMDLTLRGGGFSV